MIRDMKEKSVQSFSKQLTNKQTKKIKANLLGRANEALDNLLPFFPHFRIFSRGKEGDGDRSTMLHNLTSTFFF